MSRFGCLAPLALRAAFGWLSPLRSGCHTHSKAFGDASGVFLPVSVHGSFHIRRSFFRSLCTVAACVYNPQHPPEMTIPFLFTSAGMALSSLFEVLTKYRYPRAAQISKFILAVHFLVLVHIAIFGW